MSHLFKSRALGGFECSSHRRRDGRRLDMIAATRHEEFAFEDYRRLADIGIKSARDGIRWHLIEQEPGRFDLSSAEQQFEAARDAGVQVIWDLFHYGYPEHVDIFSVDFPRRLAALAHAFAEYAAERGDGPFYFVPVNEISFFSYIAGDIGRFYPYSIGRGDELKRQLVRAAIAAIDAVRDVIPDSRVMMSEPATFITSRPDEPQYSEPAEAYRTAQYEAFDMMAGRVEPELGGCEEYLDVIGINYYPHNQWFYPDRGMIPPEDELYRPLADILQEIYNRYRRPMFISETGTEDEPRAEWFRYVASQYSIAERLGVDLNGACLYPIVNHPGWEDERHCCNGLWDYANEKGEREIHEPLACELQFFNDRHATVPNSSVSVPRSEVSVAAAWA